MANITKIILSLNILAACAGIFFGITKSSKTSELIDSVATAKGDASKAVGKVSGLESEKAAISKQLSEKDAEHKSIKARHDQLASNTGSKDTKLANLQQEKVTLKAEKLVWLTERKSLQEKANEIVIARKELVAAKAQVQLLTADLKKIKDSLRDDPIVDPPLVDTNVRVGKIANVDPRSGSIILNRGSAHGLEVGNQFNVMRNNKLIGRVEVVRLGINTGLSIAQRAEALGVPANARFQINDDLVSFK